MANFHLQRASDWLVTQHFSSEERAILEQLDAALRSDGVRPLIEAIAARVGSDLAAHPDAMLTWEPVPLASYGADLPPNIRSSWVFVLRAGTTSGAERHPNSHQRMMVWRGSGDFKIWEDSGWQSNVLVDDLAAPLERRWVSILVNVWHKPVMGEETWVVVSFHTALANELIEERGDPATDTNLRQRTYI